MRVGIRRLDGRELRVEILVAAAVICSVDDLAAVGGETFLEKFCQAHAVIALHIGQHGHLFGLERFAARNSP